jgi:glycosyltransferase involved in cell wall biosynthesis
MGGAMRHLTSFLPELAGCDGRRQYVVLVRETFPALSLPGSIVIERVPDAQAAGWLSRAWYDVVVLPRVLRKENFEAVVSLTNFGPVWSPVPHVFFQRNPVYYSPYYLERIRGTAKVETLLRRRLALASMKRARLIVTPSNAMARMIRDMCPETAALRFYTLYHGFSNDAMGEPLDPSFRKVIVANRGWKLLYPTHAALHKGFEVLFEILSVLKSRGARFVLIAPVSDEDWPEGVREYRRHIKELGIEENVVFTGRVPQRQMGGLYSLCDLMVYPSPCESFGFSMVEAMGHGIPIVAADTAVNREMCEDGALYYPTFSADAGAAAIMEAMEPQVGARLREAGTKRLRAFDWSWKRYAREFVRMLDAAGC